MSVVGGVRAVERGGREEVVEVGLLACSGDQEKTGWRTSCGLVAVVERLDRFKWVS